MDHLNDAEVLRRLLDALERANPESRRKLVMTLATYYELSGLMRESAVSPVPSAAQVQEQINDLNSRSNSFSEDRSPSAKEFMWEKKPQTDVERIACLAYYLTHYRDEQAFKTLDLSKLNAEAAQLKLPNAAQAVDNATKSGFLITHVKGQKKLSALGELYVQALPDRVEARAAVAGVKPKRRKVRPRESGSKAQS